ncbi:MAG: antibiotic biosynthesis monooxygenase [Acidimicrobiia bacterium]
MHAVVGRVAIDSGRADEARELLDTFTIPTVKQQPGFVSGTWLRSADGTSGTSVLLVDTAEAATALATRMAEGPPPEAPVKFVSADVFEVVAQA